MNWLMVFPLQILIFVEADATDTSETDALIKRVKFVIFNPLKFIRSLFYRHKYSPTGPSHLKFHPLRRERDNVIQDAYEDILLVNKPARLKCSKTELKVKDKPVLWAKDRKSISTSLGHHIELQGDLLIDRVQATDTGTFTCQLSDTEISTHHVTVVSLPKVRIEVKYRYKTNRCGDPTKSAFKKKMSALIAEEVCSTITCKIHKVDVRCEAVKHEIQDLEFMVLIVIIVQRDVSVGCQFSCVRDLLQRESTKILQELENFTPNHGVITLPPDTFAYEPKGTLYDTKEYECGSGFEMDNDLCLPCKPGTFSYKHKCELCPLDTYNPEYGAKECYACLARKETFAEGATSVKDCIDRNANVTLATVAVLLAVFFILILIVHYIKRLCTRKKKNLNQTVVQSNESISTFLNSYHKSKSTSDDSGECGDEDSSTLIKTTPRPGSSVNRDFSSTNVKKTTRRTRCKKKFSPEKEINFEASNPEALLVDQSPAGDAGHDLEKATSITSWLKDDPNIKQKETRDAWTITEDMFAKSSFIMKQPSDVNTSVKIQLGYVKQHAARLGKHFDQLKTRGTVSSQKSNLSFNTMSSHHYLPPILDPRNVVNEVKPSQSESYSTSKDVQLERNLPKYRSEDIYKTVSTEEYRKVNPYLTRRSII